MSTLKIIGIDACDSVSEKPEVIVACTTISIIADISVWGRGKLKF